MVGVHTHKERGFTVTLKHTLNDLPVGPHLPRTVGSYVGQRPLAQIL